MSKNTQFHQSVPQESVLFPLLFTLYINSLALQLPDTNINALFADDGTILAVTHAVDIVVAMAKDWKLKLNGSKSEVSFFSLSRRLQSTAHHCH